MFRVLDAYGRIANRVGLGEGPQGFAGANGAAGSNGTIGLNGPRGFDGRDGERRIFGLEKKVRLYQDVSGNLPVTRLNSGIDASQFSVWRGDGTWANSVDGFLGGNPELYIAPDGAQENNVTDHNSTTTSAGTIVTDGDGQYARYTSAADGSVQQLRSTNAVCWPDHNPVFWARIRTGSDISNIRIWIGLSTAAFTNVDTHAGNCIAFRYSTVAGDGGWVGVNNAASQSVTSTIASIATSTKYTMKIAVTGGGTLVTFTVNGQSQTLSTQIPTGSALLYGAAVIRVSTANKVLDIKYIKVWR